MKADSRKFVRSLALFNTLTEEEFTVLHECLVVRTCKAQEILFEEGARSDEIFLVMTGELLTIVKSKSGDIVVAKFTDGEIFGEMAFFDQSPRSATCKANKESVLIEFSRDAFKTFAVRFPKVAVKLYLGIFEVISSRLHSSNTFLAEMVAWGEHARKRSITDELTGLFNRRCFDDSLGNSIFSLQVDSGTLSVCMIDIDHFAQLNREHGTKRGDDAIVILAKMLKQAFGGPKNIIARYGGDEFVLILPNKNAKEAGKMAERAIALLKESVGSKSDTQQPLRFTISMGIAEFPLHAQTQEQIVNAADRALYQAKALGRDRWHIYEPDDHEEDTKLFNKDVVFLPPEAMPKRRDLSIAQKNRILKNIIDALSTRKKIAICGHLHPDEDCLGSLAALGLCLTKLRHTVTLVAEMPNRRSVDLLKKICEHNNVGIVDPGSFHVPDIDVIIICDTAKLSLLDIGPSLKAKYNDPSVLKIEFDHHVGGDSRYIGNAGYCVVEEATSTAELMLHFLLKLRSETALLDKLGIGNLIERNIVLSLTLALLSDTQNGKFLPGKHYRHRYASMLHLLNSYLQKDTHDKRNLNNSDQIIEAFSDNILESDDVVRYFQERSSRGEYIVYAVLNITESRYLMSMHDTDEIRSVARQATDSFAEESKRVGLVGYFSQNEEKLELRMRRAENYSDIDLRNVLEIAGFEDGGGHPGAVGFRVHNISNEDADDAITDIIARLEDAMRKILNGAPDS